MPDALAVLDADLRRIHVTFGLMNMLRMSLAKHEVAGVRDSVPFAPGYGRINRWCGAIGYELSWDVGVFDTVNHRDFAMDCEECGSGNRRRPRSWPGSTKL